MGGFADYIIPLAVVIGGWYFLNKLGIFGGSGSGTPGPLSPGGLLSPQSSSTATQQATLATLDTAQTFYNNQPTSTNPFLPDLYNANPGCPDITPAQAQSLWADIQTAYTGSGFFSFLKASPDMTPLLGQFQTMVQSGCDISLVSSICLAATGQNLGDYMFNSFASDQTMANGQTNMTMLYSFIQWAFALPTGLD